MPEFDVVDLPETDHPTEGDTAPDFTRPLVRSEYWSDASLSEFTDEGPVLLVAFPMDGAFPATYVWNEIRDREWGTNGDGDRDLTVLGISISTPYEHRDFLTDRGIEYGLFSDPGAGVAAEYGIEHDLDGMRGITEHRPATFLVDGERTVRYAWVASEWPDFPDYDEVEAAIDDL